MLCTPFRAFSILLPGFIVALRCIVPAAYADTVVSSNKVMPMPTLNKIPASTAINLRLVASLPNADIEEGNMVLLKVSLENTSSNEVSLISQGDPNNEFTIIVKDNNGKVAPLSLWGKSLFKYEPGYMPTANPYEAVSGNGKKTYQFSLNRMFDLSTSGSYSVIVSRSVRLGPIKQTEVLNSNQAIFRLHEPSVNFSDPDSFPLRGRA